MNAGTALAPKQPKSKQLAQAEAELKSEAEVIEKLRVQLSSQGAAADKKQVAEFAKRQKAYLDRKIDFEKLKRSGDSATHKPEETKPKTPEPVQRQKAPPETSPAKAPAHEPEKSSARWIFWLLLAAAAGLIAWMLK